MEALDLVVMALATWRLSNMLVNEFGPGNVFQKIRTLTGHQYDEEGVLVSRKDNMLSGLFDCLWCMSIWMAGMVYLFWWLEPIFVWVIALSAGAILIDRVKE